MVEQASAQSGRRSVKSVAMGGIGGGQASNLVIQQIFVKCLRPAGHCVVSEPLPRAGPHSKRGCNIDALDHILPHVCVSGVYFLCMWACACVCVCVCVCMYVFVC